MRRHHRFRKKADIFGPMAMLFAGTMASRWSSHGNRGDDFGFGGGGRRRRRRMFGQGELRLALLALISDEPRHGYELIKAIEELTGGAYAPSPGAVYPTLQMLQDEGMIAEAKGKGARKPFEVTEEGSAELDAHSEEVEALMERLAEHGERNDEVRSHDLFRAMGNLAMVLKHRAKAGKLDEDTVNEIVDLVDELAKKVERL